MNLSRHAGVRSTQPHLDHGGHAAASRRGVGARMPGTVRAEQAFLHDEGRARQVFSGIDTLDLVLVVFLNNLHERLWPASGMKFL